ncbi:MAG: hypothetical protein ABII64_01990 [Elusimicrobiota bacterium]
MTKVITEKTKKILQMIAENGYMSVKEIEMIVRSRMQAFRYVNNLMTMKGLMTFFDTGLKPSKAYFLTKKGADSLASVGLLRVTSLFKPCDFGPTEFYHNLSIAKARIALEKHPYYLDFETPRVLMARIGDLPELKPDAEIIFRENLTAETQTFRAGLEVELRPKWHKRNIRKMKKFDSGKFNHLKSVIWVCGDSVTKDALIRSIKDSRVTEPGKHRFLLLSELLEQGVMSCRVADWQGRECGLFI